MQRGLGFSFSTFGGEYRQTDEGLLDANYCVGFLMAVLFSWPRKGTAVTRAVILGSWD